MIRHVSYGLAILAMGTATAAQAQCEDLTVTIQDPDSSRSATTLFRCVGNTYVIPGMTLVQVLEERNGRMCYSDYSCGNVKSWGGFVAVSGVWEWFDSVTDFVLDENKLSAVTDYHGGALGVEIAVEWKNIRRDCSPMSTPICR